MEQSVLKEVYKKSKEADFRGCKDPELRLRLDGLNQIDDSYKYAVEYENLLKLSHRRFTAKRGPGAPGDACLAGHSDDVFPRKYNGVYSRAKLSGD